MDSNLSFGKYVALTFFGGYDILCINTADTTGDTPYDDSSRRAFFLPDFEDLSPVHGRRRPFNEV